MEENDEIKYYEDSIYIIIRQTNNMDKTLIFILPDKGSHLRFFKLFNHYSIYWNYDEHFPLVIRLIFKDYPNFLNVNLIHPLSSYLNYEWLLNFTINTVSVGYKDPFGKPIYQDPFSINYQGLKQL